MTQEFRALTMLPESQGLTPRTYKVAHNQFRASNALFWPPWKLGMHMVPRHACSQDTHTYEIKINLF